MLALRIALRYLLARKSHNAVNVIAIIAVLGVAVASAAMVVVLSVFNGFTDLAESHISKYDPEIQVTRADGRVIGNADSLAAALQADKDIAMAMPTLSERALISTYTAQCPVRFKGVPEHYERMNHLDRTIVDGVYAVCSTDDIPAVQISVGVSNSVMLHPNADSHIEIYVPRRQGRINPANPAAAFRSSKVVISGVFQVNQQDIDADGMIVPLAVARDLLEYDTEASAVEVSVAEGRDVATVKSNLKARLGADYDVKNRLEQRAESFRMISIEKWVTFMMLIFVLVISLFNIISTLSLLVIEKRDNMATLRAFGATQSMVRRVFILEGWLITAIGGILGIAIGVALVYAQQTYHLIKIGGDSAALVVRWYPVHLLYSDMFVVFGCVLATGLLTAQITRLFLKKTERTNLY
jgi:ABC-type lipoprotein release transport system permease subunit